MTYRDARPIEHPWHQKLAGALAALIVLSGLVAACTDPPTIEEWEATWQQTSEALPPLSSVMADEPRDMCSKTLGTLRQRAADLSYAPNADLAQAFLTWSKFTESVFFDCPPNGGAHAGFEASYREIARLASEVEALLAFEHQIRSDE